MAPKEQKSKKAIKEKQARVVEDATFGLKNKNKSAKVQKFVAQVQKTVNNSNTNKVKSDQAKKDKQLNKKLEEEQMRMLLSEGIAGQHGKSKAKVASELETLGISTMDEELQKQLQEMELSDSDDEDADGYALEAPPIILEEEEGGGGEGVEIFRVKTIEDLIEEQRAKLAAEGKVGTPVNDETFAAWKIRKKAKKAAQLEAKLRAEASKGNKRGANGKGAQSALSGKELFSVNAALFVDDDDDRGTGLDESMSLEQRVRIENELAAEKAAADKAQKEQERLQEIQKAEQAAREALTAERRVKAAAPDRPTLTINNVICNLAVFDVEEPEDLQPFREIAMAAKEASDNINDENGVQIEAQG